MRNKFTYEQVREFYTADLTEDKLRELIDAQAFNAAYHGKFYVASSVSMEKWKEYRTYQNSLDVLFSQMALSVAGLSKHPKAQKIYAYAYDRGNSSGYSEILLELHQLADLFLED